MTHPNVESSYETQDCRDCGFEFDPTFVEDGLCKDCREQADRENYERY